MRKGFSARKKKKSKSEIGEKYREKKINKVWKLERVRDRLLEIGGGGWIKKWVDA